MIATAVAQESLATEGLVKEYGRRRVVDNVSISLRRREIVGLLGPNGAGKTTTFNMVVGIVKPLSGRITLGGVANMARIAPAATFAWLAAMSNVSARDAALKPRC